MFVPEITPDFQEEGKEKWRAKLNYPKKFRLRPIFGV